jgi:hypothetical protein
VNALPPLKVVQLLGNACLSPTTLAPKGPFRPRGPKWILLFSLDSVEPHRVNPNDLVGALGAIPAAWWRTSHDVLARLMFSSRADSFSPANRLHPHYQRANPSVSRASPFASVVDNNHHSFTYAAAVAERNGLKPSGRNPPNHGLKPRGLRRVQTVKKFTQLALAQREKKNYPFINLPEQKLQRQAVFSRRASACQSVIVRQSLQSSTPRSSTTGVGEILWLILYRKN